VTDEPQKTRRWRLRRPGLASQVLIGFVLGVSVGLFFGESAAFLETVGLVFIRLLQMTVLPYVVALMPLSYPDWESATFFTSSLVDEPAAFNFLDLYFTSNPFNAMASTIVPAVVVFSIALGAALIGVRGKERVIEDLSVIGDALSKLSGFVARLAPIGVFGIAAGTAGTMEFSDLGRIQVYLVPQAACPSCWHSCSSPDWSRC